MTAAPSPRSPVLQWVACGTCTRYVPIPKEQVTDPDALTLCRECERVAQRRAGRYWTDYDRALVGHA